MLYVPATGVYTYISTTVYKVTNVREGHTKCTSTTWPASACGFFYFFTYSSIFFLFILRFSIIIIFFFFLESARGPAHTLDHHTTVIILSVYMCTIFLMLLCRSIRSGVETKTKYI